MTVAFLNNVNLCFLPAHTSHGLQPLDNGPYNALKTAYRKQLQLLGSLTDAAPVDKINFIRCYTRARDEAFTKSNIISGFRTTGNWPISRRKAMSHPELQQDRDSTPESLDEAVGEPSEVSTPKTAHAIELFGQDKSPSTRLGFQKAAKACRLLATESAIKDQKIRALEAQLERLRPKKRRKVPNPNSQFMTIGEILGSGRESDQGPLEAIERAIGEDIGGEPKGPEDPNLGDLDDIPQGMQTRSGRQTRLPNRYLS